MAGVTQSLTFAQLSEQLRALGERIASLSFRCPLETAAFYMASSTKRNFDEGRTPDGTLWPPLKSPSARRGGPSAKPLRDTGLLMVSVTSKGAGHIESINDRALVFGTNVLYASYHQDGTSTIPARTFLGISQRDEDRISKIILEYVAKVVAQG